MPSQLTNSASCCEITQRYTPSSLTAVIADFLDAESTRVAERTGAFFGALDRLFRRSLEQTMAAIVDPELNQRRALVRLNPTFFSLYPDSVDVHAKVDALTRSQENPEWVRWLQNFLAEHQSRLTTTDTELLASVCHGALMGVVSRCVELPDRDSVFAEAKVELLLLLLRYLMCTPPTRQDCQRYLNALDIERNSPEERELS